MTFPPQIVYCKATTISNLKWPSETFSKPAYSRLLFYENLHDPQRNFMIDTIIAKMQ